MKEGGLLVCIRAYGLDQHEAYVDYRRARCEVCARQSGKSRGGQERAGKKSGSKRGKDAYVRDSPLSLSLSFSLFLFLPVVDRSVPTGWTQGGK